jgi:hypothetical protein
MSPWANHWQECKRRSKHKKYIITKSVAQVKGPLETTMFRLSVGPFKRMREVGNGGLKQFFYLQQTFDYQTK